jgi:hypothetical protein
MLDYLKVFPDIEILIKRYDEAQCGRLFMAMMAYAYRQELPTFEEDAPEWYVWEYIQYKIDQCAESLETKRASGKKGGSVKQTEADESTSKQTQAEASEVKQTEADESKTDIYKNKNMNKNKNKNKSSSSGYVPPTPYDDLDDDELRRLRQEQQDVETAAKRVGLPVSAMSDYDTMDNLRAEHGADNLIKAINRIQGAAEKCRSWRYVGGILRKEKSAGYTWAERATESGGGTAGDAEVLTRNPFALQSLKCREGVT